MSWLDFLQRQLSEGEGPAPRLDLPLFPINSVLFPGGALSLRVFEARYMDMAATCLREGTPFGVCLIASGKEVGGTATPHPVGTLARIVGSDMQELGILLLKLRGGDRFRIHSTRVQANGLLRAEVEPIGESIGREVPAAQAGLLPLLRQIAGDLGPDKMPEPHAFDDAAWVGYRLAEVVPVQPLAKQKLLELDDPVSRLEILHTYLAQRRLVE